MTNADQTGDLLHVLVVEDEPLVRELLVETLRLEGHLVAEAATADEALRILELADGLDVLLADILLPQSSGFEIALQARRLHPSVGLVFVTGWMPDEVEAPPEVKQPYQLLRKPLGAQDLVDAVAVVAAQRALW